ncbi:hypothetical protein ACH4UM_02195 [Streptomyces sp. NPDC020801]|uniref:hypothetical protein n=1 Tax=unclassified Streptomyces TaxID=2593676 RepID=UPI0037A3D8B6
MTTTDTTTVKDDTADISAAVGAENREAEHGDRGDTTGSHTTGSGPACSDPARSHPTGSWRRSWSPRVRGRHRRPRPRRVLLAAGGLALATGVLSLVRLAPVAPESGNGGPGSAEAEPHADAGNGRARSAGASATTGAGPAALPSATVPMGGADAAPASGTSASTGSSPSAAAALPPSALPDTTSVPTSVPTTIPEAPNPPEHRAPTGASRPPATRDPAPRPTPAPSRRTHSPAPSSGGGGGLCVPVIGLCVGVQGGAAAH